MWPSTVAAMAGATLVVLLVVIPLVVARGKREPDLRQATAPEALPVGECPGRRSSVRAWIR